MCRAYSFFRYCFRLYSRSAAYRPEDSMLNPPRVSRQANGSSNSGQDDEVELITDYSWRNFFSSINFVKIMQKLSKGRSHRIWLLVQYKSSVCAFSLPPCSSPLTDDKGDIEAGAEGVSSNATTARSQVNQESSAILRSKVAAMCVVHSFWRDELRPNTGASKHEGYHVDLPQLSTRPTRRMVDRDRSGGRVRRVGRCTFRRRGSTSLTIPA